MAIFKQTYQPVKVTKRIDGEQIETVRMITKAANVALFTSEGSEIEVVLEGEVLPQDTEYFTFEANLHDADLSIDATGISRLKRVRRACVRIMLPAKCYKQLTIETSSGDVQLQNPESEHLSIRTSSGDQELKGGHFHKTAAFEASSGDISFSDSQLQAATFITSSGEIELNDIIVKQAIMETSSGDVELKAVKLDMDLDITTSSGDVELRFRTQPCDFTLDFQGNSGEASIPKRYMVFHHKTDHKVLGVSGEGTHQVKVKTSSGDLTIR